MNRFLRTAPARHLLGAILGILGVAAACTTLAIAASGGGPVPRRESLAQAIHQGLAAPTPAGLYARITFTNNLIDSSEIQGSDPLLTGGSGRLWLSGHRLRLEIQGSNGDAQVLVNGSSFWAYDPAADTVYEGTLPGLQKKPVHDGAGEHVPSIAQIQNVLNRLAGHLSLRSLATDVAGQPAYSVRISPRTGSGLIGAAELAWDALRRVPLKIALYARGDATPVLALSVSDISFGSQPASVFGISPPSGAHVIRLSRPPARSTRPVSAAHDLPFQLDAPQGLAGRPRQSIHRLDIAGHPAALLVYGPGLGSIVVLEQRASGSGNLHLAPGGDGAPRLSLPTVSIHGTTAQQLVTAIGTVVRFTRAGVSYTILGSVSASTADAAARGL